MTKKAQSAEEPPRDCTLCPRLVEYREANADTYPGYFNGAVPPFGTANAMFLIVGLAPGIHGANQTGRPFTGDYAGDLLYATLEKYSFSSGRYGAGPTDGLKLKHTTITNAVRCVPPQNKPNGLEIRTCRPFLTNQIKAMNKLQAILCLGRISHESTIAALSLKQKDAPFGHGIEHAIPGAKFSVFDSYHCSRYNTNTKRLTTTMFEKVFANIRHHLEAKGLKPMS